MSWPPQWPGGPPQPGMPAGPPMLNPAPNVLNPSTAAFGPSAEQWAQMQQQNWQQWAQWHQQFQQWQQQYGAEYQKSLTAIQAHTAMPVPAPVPTSEFKAAVPPPLPVESKPPLPPGDPPMGITTNSFQGYPSLLQSQPVSYNTSEQTPAMHEHFQNKSDVPYKQGGRHDSFNSTNAHGNQNLGSNMRGGFKRNLNWQNTNPRDFRNNSTKEPSQPSQPPSLLSLNVQKPPPLDNKDAAKPSFNQPDVGCKRPKFDNPDNWRDKNWKNAPSPNQGWNQQSDVSSKAEELSDAEKKFDKQFADWEAQFQKWKDQNASHPDKEQYREYEKKWEAWRTQLLERREQMRRKRLGLSNPSPQTKPDVIRAAVKNQTDDTLQKSSETERMMKDPPPNFSVRPPSLDMGLTMNFSKPPPSTLLDAKNVNLGTTESHDSTGDFFKPPPAGGIPGLDLVDIKKDESKEKENVDDDVQIVSTPEKKKDGPDLEAISRNIKNILGDSKLMSMLSLVSQNQNVNTTNSASDSLAEMKNENLPTDTFNVDDQTRSSFTEPDLKFENKSNQDYDNFSNSHNSFNSQNAFGQQPNFGNNQPRNSNFDDFQQGPDSNFFRRPNFNQGHSDEFSNQENDYPDDFNHNRDSNNFNRSDNFNRGFSGPKEFNRGPNNFNRGPDFNSRTSNNFSASNDNRSPHNFGPRGSNDFVNQGPQEFNPRGSQEFNPRGSQEFNPRGSQEFNPRGPQEFNPRGPQEFNKRGPQEFNNRSSQEFNNRGPQEFNNRGPQEFNPRGPQEFNRGPNNFDAAGPNFNNRGSNNFNNASPDFNNRNSNFNSDEFGQGSNNFKSPNKFNRGNFDQNNKNDSFNRGPENFPNNPDQDGFNRRPNNFNKGPNNFNKGPNTFNRGFNNALAPDQTNQNKRQFEENKNDEFIEPKSDNLGWNRSGTAIKSTDMQNQPIPSQDKNLVSTSPTAAKAPEQKETDGIWKPTTVTDYEHKTLKPAVPDVTIEPIQTFDYRHRAVNRIPIPERPKWLVDVFKNIPDFEPAIGRPVERRYERYDLRRPPPEPYYEERRPFTEKKSFEQPFYEERRFYDERRPHGDRRAYEEKRPFDKFESEKKFNEYDYNFQKQDENQGYERQKKIDKPHVAQAYNKSNTTLIEDLLSAPARFARPSRIVIILRGPPGSGKTFLAKLIKDKEVENGGSAPRILSLDDYFMVEQEKEVHEDGRTERVKEMVYEYEEAMEASYRTSLMRSFKKTITDGYFSFIIVDNVNDKVKYFGEMWSFAKQNGFQVYVCQLELDVQTCIKRNVHGRSEGEIKQLITGWEPTPSHHPLLDATSLIQSGSIPEVEMEEINSPPSDMGDDVEDRTFSSKWDSFDYSVDNLAKLDGTSKPLRTSRTMEDYLQWDEWTPKSSAKPGQKRVRWADLEERKQQEKMRAIGFVVGQTDWDRMMDPEMGSGALTQTKYI